MSKVADILTGFYRETITLPDDYEGVVVTTLISKPCQNPSNKAVLYIHGYSDYFFQVELADYYNNKGFNFYAIDLRKYGRSLLPHQRFNFCKDMAEYYGDLDKAVSIIRNRDRNTNLLLNGHSTGGLLAAIYANDRANYHTVDALFLNSPFFDFNNTWLMETFTKITIDTIGYMTPYLQLPNKGLPLYGESISADYNRGGDQHFNEDWKPASKWTPPVLAGWVRAIHKAHERVQWGLAIKVPTLVMYSDKSGGGVLWNESYTNSDCVLDVKEINKYTDKLCWNDTKLSYIPPTEIIIKGGLHDLACSRQEARTLFYTSLGFWLDMLG